VKELLGLDFRANPHYELVLYDRLAADEKQRLAGLLADPGLYGILRPTGGSPLGWKSVDRDTALLFLTLREPGPLPSYLQAILGESLDRTVMQLVADGVFEVEAEGGGGAFVSGPAALDLDHDRGGSQDAGGPLQELSLAALVYGQALARTAAVDPALLTLRLYGYNRRPLTPAWKRLLPDAPAVERFLGIDPGGTNRKLLEQRWSRRPGFAGWMSWRRRGTAGERPAARGTATYKLYVSPVPEALPTAFGEILAALDAARVPQVKIGCDGWGLLRPDKIVAHFPDLEALAASAARLAERLGGIPVQGVPFTAEIGGGGLLSWGVDPPTDGVPAAGRESWRTWLCQRLALALFAARETSPEPWRFALERLRLEGVDTATWAPGALVFRQG
jgi:hypothetical protein